MVNGLISILGAAPSGWMTDNLPGHMLLAGSLLLQVRAWNAAYYAVPCDCEPGIHQQAAAALAPATHTQTRMRTRTHTNQQAVGLYYVAGQTSLFAVAAVFGSIALTWNIVNTAGNVLCLQQAPEVRCVYRGS